MVETCRRFRKRPSRTEDWEARAHQLFEKLTANSYAELAYEHDIPVNQVRNTHDSVCGYFRDGRSLEQMVEAFLHNQLFPTDVPLIAVYIDHEYWSLNNRRCACLKEYQRRISRSAQQVIVRLCVLPAWAIAEKFIRSWTAPRDPLNKKNCGFFTKMLGKNTFIRFPPRPLVRYSFLGISRPRG
jgi:hypothetical protein